MVRLEFQCIETEISARRDSSLSMVGLESHSAEIIWYLGQDYIFSFSVISNVCKISQSPFFLRSLTAYRDDINLRVNYYIIVWMWRLQTFFHTLPHINQRVAPFGATLRLLLCVTKIT